MRASAPFNFIYAHSLVTIAALKSFYYNVCIQFAKHCYPIKEFNLMQLEQFQGRGGKCGRFPIADKVCLLNLLFILWYARFIYSLLINRFCHQLLSAPDASGCENWQRRSQKCPFSGNKLTILEKSRLLFSILSPI